MRKGIILSYNRVVGIGIIKDENDQHILFYMDTRSILPVRNSSVTFDIQYQRGSLIATNVKFSQVKVLSDNLMLSE